MIDKITKITLPAMIALHREELRNYELVAAHEVNCRGCRESDKGTPGMCKRWGMQPPPEVQAVGCDEWRYDEIPF